MISNNDSNFLAKAGFHKADEHLGMMLDAGYSMLDDGSTLFVFPCILNRVSNIQHRVWRIEYRVSSIEKLISFWTKKLTAP